MATVKLPQRQVLHLAAGAAAFSIVCLMMSHGASSQTARTIKIVVPFAPGGPNDTLARLLGEQIGRAQGQTMVVENRPGAGAVIGTEAVSRATPDGNTVLMVATSFITNPHLRKQNYDPLTSFEPICNLVNVPLVIVVNSASPYRTIVELLNAARSRPGDLTLASTGPASPAHLAIEALKRVANINMTYVPYPGDAPAVTALLGEHVTSALVTYTAVAEQLKLGKLRALAIPSGARVEPLPDVPTIAESGYKEADVDLWIGMVAPEKTPKDTISQLAGWFTTAMRAPEVKTRLVTLGLYPVGTCGAEFGAYLRKQYNDYGRIIREANIKAE